MYIKGVLRGETRGKKEDKENGKKKGRKKGGGGITVKLISSINNIIKD